MTSTAVKGVGNVLNQLTTGAAGQAGAKGKTGAVSFQSVWNSQTGKSDNAQTAQTQTPQKTVHKQTARDEEAADSQGIQETTPTDAKSPVDGDLETADQTGEMPDEETLEKAMEVLGAMAVQFLDLISDTLGISVEDLRNLLGQMDMEPVSLLNPENLSAFLLKAGGAEDTFALVTDEKLYGDFKTLMGELDTMLAQDAGIGDMTVAEAVSMTEFSVPQDEAPKMQEAVVTTTAEEEIPQPVVEVTVEDAVSETRQSREESRDVQEQPDLRQEEPEQTRTEPETQKQDGHREHAEHEGHHQTDHSFLPGRSFEEPVLQPMETPEAAGGFRMETQDIMRQIMDYMKIQVRSDLSNLQMQLHPESLGTLQIQVASKGGVVTANFIAQNEAVKAALESQMVQLKENFAEQGIKVEAIEVTVQTHEFEQNLEQGRGRSQENTSKGQKGRRLKLDDISAEELEALPNEERLTAQMMAANGSTVDYTA